MSDYGLARVHFYPKQYLGLKDFEDEQHYHLTRLRQHQISHHSWGIVRGLELALNTEENILVVKPGVAVDGYGRLLVLSDSHDISNDEFVHRGSDMLDVWLVYALQESDLPRPGSTDCVPSEADAVASGNERNTPAQTFTRWQEQPVVRLTVPNPANPIEPRQPADVPEANWNFAPTRIPPDSPLDDWPVYLGRATRTQDKPPKYTPDLTKRPYAGLVGEVIRHPAGRARVQIGSSQLQDPDDIRFAVFIEDSEKKDSVQGSKRKKPAEDRKQNNAAENARLEINKKGNITMRGTTTVEGDIHVSSGGVEFGGGKEYKTAQPWRFYRVTASQDEDGKPLPEQWRLELGPDGEFSIGYFSSQDKKYKHCLRLQRSSSDDANGGWAVSIDGNLHVQGLIRENVLVPPELAIQAKTLVTQAFMAPLLGQVVTPHPLSPAKPSPIKLPKVETHQPVNLIAREVFKTNPALVKDLALALAKENTSLQVAKALVVALTELIKPGDDEVLKQVKGALDI